ncbi:MAG: hemolysin III family protein [Steroidobacteraceae bacterium]|jgi:hemolysin III|nr:hemolysin III family protein [Steroidobacteraceae bacterium]
MATLPYTRPEERLHAALHALGALASAAAIPWLAIAGAGARDPLRLAGGVVFAVTALLLFTTSVLYHVAEEPRLKQRMRTLDHAAIYLLIAGTYTPFTIGAMRGAWGWTLFVAIWVLAVLGVVAKTTVGFRYPRVSTLMYLGMGWAAVVAVRPLSAALTDWQFGWLVAGGLLYTAGVPFYVWKSRRYTHAVWHAFVLAGVGCHFVAVLAVTAGRG